MLPSPPLMVGLGRETADSGGAEASAAPIAADRCGKKPSPRATRGGAPCRSEEHTSELQSRENLVCRLRPSHYVFPYTTLFRSHFALGAVAQADVIKLDDAPLPSAHGRPRARNGG